jgi:hypothetical protein
MAQVQQQDAGLVQRGLLLLGGMIALVVVVLLIALRNPDGSPKPEAPAGDPGAPSAPGWEIRYNAAVTLARRGSARTPWPLIREMLDENQQRRNFRVPLKDGKEGVDEESATRAVQNTLAAVGEWHRKQDRAAPPTVSDDLRAVYEQVDRLAEGPNTMLRVQADRVRQTFKK